MSAHSLATADSIGGGRVVRGFLVARSRRCDWRGQVVVALDVLPTAMSDVGYMQTEKVRCAAPVAA